MTRRSTRQIAALSGVSAGQISRFANDRADRPTFDTVVRLAPTLGIHPACLYVLGGLLSGKDARRALSELLDQAADAIVDAYGDGGAYLERLRLELNTAADESALRACATQLVTIAVHDVDHPKLPALTAVEQPDADLLNTIWQAWPHLTSDRRWRLVELLRDLKTASLQERHAHSVTRDGI